jgi:hypothetical protein
MAKAPLLARSLRQRLASLSGLSSGVEERRRPAGRPPRQAPKSRPAQSSSARIVLQALLHRPGRLGELTELVPGDDPELARLAAVLAVMREHPELAEVRGLLEFYRGRPEEELVRSAAAGLLEWADDYDSEADLRGAWATLVEQSARRQVNAFAGKKLSDISAEDRASYMAALKEKKLDRLSGVKSER